jgi:hypothetical protein
MKTEQEIKDLIEMLKHNEYVYGWDNSKEIWALKWVLEK